MSKPPLIGRTITHGARRKPEYNSLANQLRSIPNAWKDLRVEGELGIFRRKLRKAMLSRGLAVTIITSPDKTEVSVRIMRDWEKG